MNENMKKAKEILETSSLTDFEKKVISMRLGFIESKIFTLDECAQLLNVSIDHIRVTEIKALRRLRHPLRSRKLKDYLDIDNAINPWNDLRKINNQYIATCDIEQMNIILKKISKNNNSSRILLNIIPQPYVGNPDTSIIYFLLSNPSPLGTENEYSEELLINNLLHKNIQYPFFIINPKYKNSEAYNWWYNKLRFLIKATSIEIVSQYFFAIDYMAYFSKEYPYLKETFKLPSQEYSCYLIKQAIKNGKIIIIARFKREWYSKIPELEKYENTIELKNPRCVVISDNNIKRNNGNDLSKVINKLIDENDRSFFDINRG